ncbi:hypothetical protein LJC57_09865, partial [Parabacteroides sp. OttesenSCG-928-G07]|nr:hypothetical protein [Parabacteroides sp. OttesenSCG-928-G07]
GKSFSFTVKSEKVSVSDFKLLYDVTGVSVGLNDRNSQAYKYLIRTEAATDDGNGKKLQKFTITIPKQADDRRVPIDIQIYIRNSESYNYYQMITLRSRPDYNGMAGLQPVKVGGIFWAPVNVGQTDIAGSTTPSLANWGYHFQYGRNKGFDPEKTDYEKLEGPVSYASVQEPDGENMDKFITRATGTGSSGVNTDWLDVSNTADVAIRDALWSKNVNDSPCPTGWRLPNKAEGEVLSQKYNKSLTVQNGRIEIAGDEPGKTFYLTAAGQRSRASGNVITTNTSYWLIDGNSLSIKPDNSAMGAGYYSYGYFLRCIQE